LKCILAEQAAIIGFDICITVLFAVDYNRDHPKDIWTKDIWMDGVLLCPHERELNCIKVTVGCVAWMESMSWSDFKARRVIKGDL